MIQIIASSKPGAQQDHCRDNHHQIEPPSTEACGEGEHKDFRRGLTSHASHGKDSSSRGKKAIVGKLISLPFPKIVHSITVQDHQPTPDCNILSMVVGQLKVDDDPVMGFHQSFLLKNINSAWVCTNDMFRLAIHNFG
uniref:NTF2-related export protein n=1 Tax=Gasterosteus aculeatus aculeatus TaxID=481459 RepID=A0AAQ4QQK7_GASAC